MSAISAVLFDMGGVLLTKRRSYQTNATLDAIENIICSDFDSDRAKNKAITELKIDEVTFFSGVSEIPRKYEKDERLWGLLAVLKGKKRTAILNNGASITLDSFDENFGIYGAVDVFMNSALKGVAKPEPAFFLRACERLQVFPHQCLFIDDTKEHVVAAEQLGMRGFHWSGAEGEYQMLVEILE
ncbi:HAD-IA family hydrolase [Uliginosibacterium sp. 31-12]|uniref:HAD-IA family hydrolase n=1 Tax=Uliginosibacterium sp. 31-12 TaxID=3062781 RepID=UPI0026E33A84|nr:HAD-IA family hydrolase [Uliginosibacterium sp. 31-12]MDO6388450.1 HAD-IA family hydrolase [Uliginosibacterium sp. 31-12]